MAAQDPEKCEFDKDRKDKIKKETHAATARMNFCLQVRIST
jgi:hypothetical protein